MLKFLDVAGTMISREYESGHVVVVEAGDPRFDEWLAMEPSPYIEPQILIVDTLTEWRKATVLSRLELARGLKRIGILDHAQAMAFISYQPLPEPIAALIATLPDAYREDAEFEMQGGRDFPRDHPMWDLLVSGEGWPDEADVDELFGWNV